MTVTDAHRVRGCGGDAGLRQLATSYDVAPADDDGQLHPPALHLRQRPGNAAQTRKVDAQTAAAPNASPLNFNSTRRYLGRAEAMVQTSSPTSKRTKRRTWIFSPNFASDAAYPVADGH